MDESLGKPLSALHGKLDEASSISEGDRELLRQVAADIQAVLVQPSAPSIAGQMSLRDRLESVVDGFEGSHQDLTATIMQVCKALGDMGI